MSNFSKKYNNFLAPEAVIKIDGKKLSDQHIYFTSLEVDKSFDGADTFSFSISDAIDLEFEPKPEHKKLFDLGNQVEIYFGYAQSGEEELNLLFVGLITNVNWSFEEGNYLDISIEGQDYSFLLMKHHYKKTIQEESISKIVQKLIDEVYKQTFKESDIEQTDVVYHQTQNQDKSDYLFIKSLAEKVGYEFYVDKRKLVFKSPPKDQKSSFTLHYGQEILSFKPELNIGKVISKVRVIGLEFSSDNESIVGEAELEQKKDAFNDSNTGIKTLLRKLNSVEYEVREPVNTVEEAKQRAESLLRNFSLNYFKAKITLIGIPELIPGITISLEGLGKRFSRDYYVEKAVHSISDQGYETTINVRGSSNSFKISKGG